MNSLKPKFKENKIGAADKPLEDEFDQILSEMNYDETVPSKAKGSPTKIHNKLKPANQAKKRAQRSHANNFELKESDHVYFDNFKENDPNLANTGNQILELQL